MANPTNPFNWQMPTSTDLVTDLPADFETFGQAVATSMADLLGGTSGQILAKASNTDMDFTWITNDVGDITAVTAGTGISGGGTSGAVTITNSMATEIAAKGDLIAGTGSQTFDNVAVGTNGQVLTADSTTATGLKWGATGLTLVKTQTIGTAVNSVTVTDAFNSTYENYFITVSGGVSSAASGITLVLGSAATGYYKFLTYGTYSSNTVNGIAANNAIAFNDAGYATTNSLTMNIQLMSPNAAKRTHFMSNFAGSASTSFAGNQQGFLDDNTQYTAFTISLGASITATGGTIRVYGYQNS